MNSYDFSNVEVIEGHSITEEAFENFGNESVQENVSFNIPLNGPLEDIFQEIGTESLPIDQNSRNECFDQNDETKTGKNGKEYKHLMTEEISKTLGEESSQENVSFGSSLKTIVEEKRIDSESIDSKSIESKSIDQTEKSPENEFVEACKEKDNFICNSCNADDWFDCLCSETEDETMNPQNEKIMDQKPTKTKQNDKEIQQKSRKYVCNFNDCDASFRSSTGLKLHIDSIHMNWRPFKCHECGSSFTQNCVLQGMS